MADRIIRAVTCDGAIKILAMTARETVEEARRIHDLTPLTSAALGRTLVAASLLGNDLKGENDTIAVRIDSDGPIGSIVAVSDSFGYVRGYCKNPQADLPVRESDRKIDVSGGVGNGTLIIIKDLGMKEPYIGQTQLVSGEIAEDITAYLATSEQIPSVCALGVLVERDWSIRAAGGYIIQLLPGVYDDEIDRLTDELEKKNEGADIEIFAKEELGMISQEHAKLEYINSNKTDEVARGDTPTSILAVLEWLFPFLR